MKKIFVIISIFILHGFTDLNQTASDKDLCYKYIHIEKNKLKAHTNTSCISAANSGVSGAQYSVGLGYYTEGKTQEALDYFMKAAKNKVVNAYLPIAHILNNTNEAEAIYWYEKYINATINTDDNGGAGYAALILAKIYKQHNNSKKTQYWLKTCKNTRILVECKL